MIEYTLIQIPGHTVRDGKEWLCTVRPAVRAYPVQAAFWPDVYAYRYHKDRHLIQCPVKAVDFSQQQGVPDGMAMDRDGTLWIAMWGGYKVICINPVSGAKLGEVVLPDANVSCCTFGGEHLDRLYITSARDGQGGVNVFEADAGAAGTDPYEFCWKEEEII